MTEFVKNFFDLVKDFAIEDGAIARPDVEPLQEIWYVGPKVEVAYQIPQFISFLLQTSC